MLDLRWILANREEAERCLRNRRHDFDLGERKRVSQARHGLIDELDFGDGQEADRKH